MNHQWHQEHKLKSDASPLARVSWHEAHQKNCGCQPIPPDVMKLMPPSAEQT